MSDEERAARPEQARQQLVEKILRDYPRLGPDGRLSLCRPPPRIPSPPYLFSGSHSRTNHSRASSNPLQTSSCNRK